MGDPSFSSAEDAVSRYVRSNKTCNSEPIAAFIFMGKTGAGKSSMIKLLGGKDLDGLEPNVDDGLESCTTTPILYETEIDNKMVLLLDTPGFDDSEQSNLDILREIVSNLYLFALRPSEVQVRGVIFLHDITETRLSGSQRMTWQILKAICGEESMRNVLVGTTQWSSDGERRFLNEENREKELYSKHWGGIYKSSRVVYGDRENALQIIRDLLDRPPATLLVQTEMVSPPHTVEATTAGRTTMPAAFIEIKRLEKEMVEQQRMNEEAMSRTEEAHRKDKDAQKRVQEEELIRRAEAEQRRAEENFREQREREEARLREEQERRTQHEEEVKRQTEVAQRLAKAEELRRRAEADEQTRREEEARKQAEEYQEIRLREEQEQLRRYREEIRRQAEEANRVEEARRRAEMEERARSEEAARRQAEEEQRKREEVRQKEEREQQKQYEEEIRKHTEELKRQLEEAQRCAEVEAQKIREEQIRIIEAERQRWEEEQRQHEAEARRQEEERRIQLEAENNRLREEASREQERLQREINEANQRQLEARRMAEDRRRRRSRRAFGIRF